MRQLSRSALILILVVVATVPSWSALSDYDVTTVSSERIALGNPTVVWAGSQGVSYANQVSQFDIGFTFRFDGVTYTRMSVSTNGVLGLGTTNVTNSPTN